MSTLTWTWQLPEDTPRRRPVAGVEFRYRYSDAFDWTLQATIPSDQPQELAFQDIQSVVQFVQLTVVDTLGEKGIPVESSYELGFEVGQVSGLTATYEE